ncbi:MAG: hypothetical protein MN733_36520, partial [Nitrososphaera sp.]|nr:hypothetical protein [Nitrososphaera sp.]
MNAKSSNSRTIRLVLVTCIQLLVSTNYSSAATSPDEILVKTSKVMSGAFKAEVETGDLKTIYFQRPTPDGLIEFRRETSHPTNAGLLNIYIYN